ncbi:MAG: hypothetical protein PHX21_05590 [bacterium]|nr:hypothetical protein [bacterium]
MKRRVTVVKTIKPVCIIFLFTSLFLSCTKSQVIPLSKKQDCLTSIEGYYSCKDKWIGEKPALILWENGNFIIIKGKVISYDEKGVNFDPDKEGAFYDPKPHYYLFNEIETFIDETGKVISGAIPNEYSQTLSIAISLKSTVNPKLKTISLLLNPNKDFGFCIPAGTYSISEISFIDKNKNIDCGVHYPEILITIDENCSNYIGNLFLYPEDSIIKKDSILIPIKHLIRQEGAQLSFFLGGALAEGAYLVYLNAKGIIGEQKLYINSDTTFKNKCKSPIKNNPLRHKN